MANQFLKAAEVLTDRSYLSFLEYNTIKQDNKEFIRNDLWELLFVQPPVSVYWPGDEIISARLMSVDPSLPSGVTGISKTIRGFVINQKTSVETNGSATLNFVDREDQAISAFIDDWRQKIQDRKLKFSFRKEDTIAQLKINYYNTSRAKIKEIILFGCQPNDGSIPEGGESEGGGDNSEVSLTLDYEHFDRRFTNISE